MSVTDRNGRGRCAAHGCTSRQAEDAPVPLCRHHIRLGTEWDSSDGIEDLLPAPCRLCGSPRGIRYPSGWVCSVCEWRHGEIPDGELPPPRIDVVYVIRLGDRAKIGTSANPRQRIAALWHDEVLAFERGGRALERRRHERFAADRLGTSEWFSYSSAIREHVREINPGGDDPWDTYVRWMAEALSLRG